MKQARPKLRVYRGGWDNAVREEAGAELVSLETEARAHVRRMELALQTRLFDEYPFSAVRRKLLVELHEFGRKFEDHGPDDPAEELAA